MTGVLSGKIYIICHRRRTNTFLTPNPHFSSKIKTPGVGGREKDSCLGCRRQRSAKMQDAELKNPLEMRKSDLLVRMQTETLKTIPSKRGTTAPH